MSELKDHLVHGMSHLGVPAANDTIRKLLRFQKLLEKWNRVYNLTNIKDPAGMIRSHLLDSLAVAKYISGTRIADVGTGAGLPGIPLALVARGKRFYLVDCDSKKTRFVQQAAIELKLSNVEIFHGRAEDLVLPHKVDVVVSRAFSSLPNIVEKTKHLLNQDSVILALKGKYPKRELELMDKVSYTSVKLDIPGLDARHLISIYPDQTG